MIVHVRCAEGVYGQCQAAEQGHSRAQYQLAEFYDFEPSSRLWSIPAYSDKYGIFRDKDKAIEFKAFGSVILCALFKILRLLLPV